MIWQRWRDSSGWLDPLFKPGGAQCRRVCMSWHFKWLVYSRRNGLRLVPTMDWTWSAALHTAVSTVDNWRARSRVTPAPRAGRLIVLWRQIISDLNYLCRIIYR
jgi:hypothetical protein